MHLHLTPPHAVHAVMHCTFPASHGRADVLQSPDHSVAVVEGRVDHDWHVHTVVSARAWVGRLSERQPCVWMTPNDTLDMQEPCALCSWQRLCVMFAQKPTRSWHAQTQFQC